MHAPFPASYPNPHRLRNILIAAAIAAAVVAVGLALGVTLIANARDESSYGAGRATGITWAQGMVRTAGRGSPPRAEILGTAGSGYVPDAEILGICPEEADFAQKALVYYYSGGEIGGRDIRRDDFITGCVDGARSVLGSASTSRR